MKIRIRIDRLVVDAGVPLPLAQRKVAEALRRRIAAAAPGPAAALSAPQLDAGLAAALPRTPTRSRRP